MKNHLFVFGIIFLFVVIGFQPAFANNNKISRVEQQPRDGTFIKSFGEDIIIEEGYYVQQTTDGGYILVGNKDADFRE